MTNSMKERIMLYAKGILEIYGINLKSVILYGSYARGDYSNNSDVDIMILVDLEDEDIVKTREKVSYYTYDFNMNNDTDIIPLVKNKKHFDYWRDSYPFYNNIQREGVELYVS